MHILPLFCDDLIASTVDMSAACFGAYMRLLCFAWTRGGLPDNEAACARIAGGMKTEDWRQIRARLTVLEDGRLSHDRLERERAAVAAHSAKKSEAGKKGNATRWGSQEPSQTDRTAIAERSQTVSQVDPKTIAPFPFPFPEEEKHSARASAPPPKASEPEDEFRRPGWVHDEWAAIVPVWNAIERAVPWTHLNPPNDFAELAASPGRMADVRKGLELLPGCVRFTEPVPWTQFVRELDRIIALEFRTPPRGDSVRGARKQPVGGNMR
jgi:uncharacterized protein YdaU (DUF1376 family)